MKSRTGFRFVLLGLVVSLLAGARPAAADMSHARIVRLSLVQGDARFTRAAGNDPLTDTKAVWETAIANLPIQQGYVLSTGNGRAEVEFESGANAYLDENSMLEFYELSLSDGARITQLILRQGTASFYVHPARGDVFSATGGDFTVEASGRASFRVNSFDDGSSVGVEKGRVSVQTKSQTIEVEKGQSATVAAGGEATLTVGALPASDDFDAWVSGRAESVASATNSAMQYVSSPYYSSGLADLYTYGSWFNYGGYGYCWRPIGVGFGWSPFSMGEWVFAPGFGWSWVSFEPWGWMPYHFGGWLYSPIYGWVWAPGGIGSGTGRYWRPVTAVWVRSGSTVGLVPAHPMDRRGKTPINIERAILPLPTRGGGEGTRIALALDAGAKWKVMKEPPEGAVRSGLVTAAPPTRVPRTVLAGSAGARGVTLGRDSSIVYDGRERKFVNSNTPPMISRGDTPSATRVGDAKSAAPGRDSGPAGVGGAPGTIGSTRNAPATPRITPPSPTVRIAPPPRSSSGGSSASMGGGARSSGASSSGGSSARTGGGSSSSGGGARPSSGGARPSGGGRPH